MKKLPIPGVELEVSQSTSDWKKHLILVLTNPHRLLGLVPLNEKPWTRGEPFELFHVCTYASQIGFQPAPNGQGVTIGGPRLVIPFDGLSPVYSIRVSNYAGTTFPIEDAADSPLRETLIDGYLRLFDPPKIVQPPPPGSKGHLDLIGKP